MERKMRGFARKSQFRSTDMNENDYKQTIDRVKNRERRYQWAITTILSAAFLVIGFLGGMLFEAQLMKNQVVRNTVKIESFEKSLEHIDAKLDRILEAN